jgi:hypothetical protein
VAHADNLGCGASDERDGDAVDAALEIGSGSDVDAGLKNESGSGSGCGSGRASVFESARRTGGRTGARAAVSRGLVNTR